MNPSRLRLLVVCGTMLLVAGHALQAEDEAPTTGSSANELPPSLTDKQRQAIPKLVRRLEGGGITAVRSAYETLRGMGEPVLPHLEQAIDESDDAKLQDRLQVLMIDVKTDTLAQRPLKLDMILEEVRQANRDNFDEEYLQVLLNRLLTVLRQSTGDEFLQLSAEFKQLERLESDAQALQGNLVIGDAVTARHAQGSIILADSVADIDRAKDCIILARVAARIDVAQNCLIVSGFDAELSITQNSMVFSDGILKLTRDQGSILGATDSIQLNFAGQGTRIVESDGKKQITRGGSSSLKVAGLLLQESESENSLSDKFGVTNARAGKISVRLRPQDGSSEFVANIDQEIKAADGTPVADLRGWQLAYVGRGFAVLSDGSQYCRLKAVAK